MDADEHVRVAVDVALDQRDVVLVVHQRAVADSDEVPEGGGQLGGHHALDELLVAAAVGDQVGDRDHLQAVALAEGDEVRHPGHRAVVVHDLADHAGRVEAGQPREVDAASVWPARSSTPPRLGLAAGTRGRAGRCSRGLDLGSIATWMVRARSAAEMPVVTPARASIETVNAVSNADLVLGRHQVQPELVAALGGQRQADQAAAVPWP